MPKAFLHLGAHKTATTFIQANLGANRDAFEKQGWKLIHFQKDIRALRKHILVARRGKNLREQGQRKLNNFYEKLRKDPHDIFFSSEIFLGQMSVRRSGKIYPHHASMISGLRENFSGREVKIGFCIRNFVDYIESGYNWMAKRGAVQSFSGYAKRVSPSTISWVSIIESFADTFGPENLVLWTYEDFRKDAPASFLKIIKAAGVDTTDITVPVQNARNVSDSPEAVEVLRHWNKMLRARREELSRKERDAFRGKLRALFAELPPSKKKRRHFGSKKRENLNAHYEQELAQIRERWGAQMLDFPSPS